MLREGQKIMKIGLVTYVPEKVAGYDLHVYYSKWADGQVFPAAKDMQNDVTCFVVEVQSLTSENVPPVGG